MQDDRGEQILTSLRTPAESETGSAAQRAAERLRAIILAAPAGAYLGSQPEMVERLGVSGVTLKQTARILELESLLEVRRGAAGGYYGARPDLGAVERAVSVYLLANGAGLTDSLDVAFALGAEILALAARSEDPAARAALRDLQARAARDAPGETGLDSLTDEFFAILFRMAANPLGELMLRVSFNMAFNERPGGFAALPGAAALWRRIRAWMITAILDRDPELVRVLADGFGRRLSEQLRRTP